MTAAFLAGDATAFAATFAAGFEVVFVGDLGDAVLAGEATLRGEAEAVLVAFGAVVFLAGEAVADDVVDLAAVDFGGALTDLGVAVVDLGVAVVERGVVDDLAGVAEGVFVGVFSLVAEEDLVVAGDLAGVDDFVVAEEEGLAGIFVVDLGDLGVGGDFVVVVVDFADFGDFGDLGGAGVEDLVVVVVLLVVVLLLVAFFAVVFFFLSFSPSPVLLTFSDLASSTGSDSGSSSS